MPKISKRDIDGITTDSHNSDAEANGCNGSPARRQRPRRRRRCSASREGETTGPRTNPSHLRDDEDCAEKKPRHGVSRRRGPLSGCLLAVSSLLESLSSTATSWDKETSPPGTEDSYNNLIQLCHQSGAQTTSQVHKRVSCVVATEAAVLGETQRVRKAWKKGIPVVSPDWVRQCVASGTKVAWGDFVYKQPKQTRVGSLPEASTSHVTSKASNAPNAVDLGCCCACHDSNDINCPWCINCRAALDAQV